MGLRTRSRGFAAAAFAAVALSAPAAAQDNELARLHQEAAALRQALDRLEARIQALEKSAGTANASPGFSRSPDALASLKSGWVRVAPGLQKDEVEALLGKPERVLRIDNTLVWYYVYPEAGRGSVFFNASGRVSSKQSPGAGW